MERNSFFLQELGSNSPGFLELESQKKGTQNGLHNLGAKVDCMFPAHKACAAQDMLCFAALADATTGTMYTDLTSGFPVRSFKNMQYIFVAYIYDLNIIIVRPMPSH
jgi:hypothetical protein